MNFNNIFYLPNNAQNIPTYKKVELFYILFMLRLQSQAWVYMCSASQLILAPFQELDSHVARGSLDATCKGGRGQAAASRGCPRPGKPSPMLQL